MRKKHPKTSAAALIALVAEHGTFFDKDGEGKLILDDPDVFSSVVPDYHLLDMVMAEADRNAEEIIKIVDDAFWYSRECFDTFMRTMPYPKYLKTDHWSRCRKRALEAAGHRCQLCNSTHRLQVHHRTYERRGNESPDDVIVLCSACHQLFHTHRRVTKEGN